jgi:S-adenosylmethionine decarboxylase
MATQNVLDKEVLQAREDEKTVFSVHLTADFYAPKFIEDPRKLRKILYDAAKAANNTPLKTTVYKFPVQGITGVILLAESHIAIHTWPESNYMAVDIFTCGHKTRPVGALEYLKEVFCPQKVKIRHIRRGIFK